MEKKKKQEVIIAIESGINQLTFMLYAFLAGAIFTIAIIALIATAIAILIPFSVVIVASVMIFYVYFILMTALVCLFNRRKK